MPRGLLHANLERVGVIVAFKEYGRSKVKVVYIEDENGIQYVYRSESLRVIA